jgi:hypothetical protein
LSLSATQVQDIERNVGGKAFDEVASYYFSPNLTLGASVVGKKPTANLVEQRGRSFGLGLSRRHFLTNRPPG